MRRQLWWPCPSSSLRRAPLGALTSQCSLSLLFAQPPPPRAVEACSAALWAVVQFPAGGDRGLCQCASVPPQNPNLPPPAGAIAPTPVSFSSLSEYAHWCSNKLSIFLRVRHNRRISDQDSRGLLKTNTLEQS